MRAGGGADKAVVDNVGGGDTLQVQRPWGGVQPLPRGAGLIKICGLREPEHARAAVTAGADALGFIFAPARRRVTVDEARRCIEAGRAAALERGRGVLTIGVFVDATADEMNAATAAGLDLLQLHGDEDPALLARLARPVVKALRPPPMSTAKDVSKQMDRFRSFPSPPVAFLVDGFAAAARGGVGVRADWALVGEVARDTPVMLAGGLDPDNVGEAILAAAPAGVDVSSGVETDGVKDAAKIAAFVSAARWAFGERGSV